MRYIVDDRVSVGGGNGAEQVGAVEKPCVEEVGGLPAGFQCESAEGEDVAGEAGIEEGGFVEGGRLVCDLA